MKLKIFSLLVFGFFALQMHAQTEEPNQPTHPENSLGEFEELLRNFGFGDIDGGMMMDTMIIKQFGGDFDMAEMDQMMQEMMKMFGGQFQHFDFGNMDGFDQFFEEFDLDSLDLKDLNIDPNSPGLSDEELKKLKQKKKRKTYKL